MDCDFCSVSTFNGLRYRRRPASDVLDALSGINKKLNIKRGGADIYEQVFERIHNAGIAVLGAFIFGMDEDTPDTLRDRAQYMLDSGVDVMQTSALTPLPGTRLFARLKEEGRLLFTGFPKDWDRYDLTEVVYRPRQMGAAEFSRVMRECLAKIYAKPVLKAKARQTLKCTGRWDATEFAYQSNKNYQAIAMAANTFT